MEASRIEAGAQPPQRPKFLGLRNATPDAWVTLGLGLWAVIGGGCTLFWVLGGGGAFWPVWVWLGLGAAVAAGGAVRIAWHVSPGPARWAVAHAGLALVASAALVLVWILTGAGSWLWWPLLGIALAFTVHALLAFADRLPPRPRERALAERVDELVRTRRGALDVQAALLRQIEQDLHDGAQSRLVALALLLARAEERLDPDSEAAGLVHKAREEAGAAVGELRDLGRGLAPPLLAERGLVPAVKGLILRSGLSAPVFAKIERRPPAPVEAAAYFVVSETLANVLKHAPGASARVSLTLANDMLTAEVADDGPGGADAEGSGLRGLRHRVEALDGRLAVRSGAGGTLVRAEIPCG